MPKMNTYLDNFYKTKSSTLHANLGCSVEQNKNITKIDTRCMPFKKDIFSPKLNLYNLKWYKIKTNK